MNVRTILLLVCTVVLTACGISPDPALTEHQEPAATVLPSLTPDDPLRQDAAAIADDLGITSEEALRRLQLQDAIAHLDATLAAEHSNTFAGLWIQHAPLYRVVVAFTRDGTATIRPYIEGTPLESAVEVRTAALTLQELQAVQAILRPQLDALGLPFDSGINVQANQVELYVTDRPLFEQRMAEAGLTLSPHIVVITTYEPVGAVPPFPVTPVPDVAMPQFRVRSGAMMQALLTGKLVVEEGCLRVREDGSDTSYLVIWQPDYYLTVTAGMPTPRLMLAPSRSVTHPVARHVALAFQIDAQHHMAPRREP